MRIGARKSLASPPHSFLRRPTLGPVSGLRWAAAVGGGCRVSHGVIGARRPCHGPARAKQRLSPASFVFEFVSEAPQAVRLPRSLFPARAAPATCGRFQSVPAPPRTVQCRPRENVPEDVSLAPPLKSLPAVPAVLAELCAAGAMASEMRTTIGRIAIIIREKREQICTRLK